jgi:hypothetical protein
MQPVPNISDREGIDYPAGGAPPIGYYVPGTAAAPTGISDVAVTPLSSTSVEVTWTTPVAASSQVEYGTSAGPPYPFSSTFDATQVTEHSVTLTGLTPATTYHFRPVSWVIP